MNWVEKKLKYIEINGPSDNELNDIEADFGLQESVNDVLLYEENDDYCDIQDILNVPVVGVSDW